MDYAHVTLLCERSDIMNANEFITLYLNASEESRYRFEELLKELEAQSVSPGEDSETA